MDDKATLHLSNSLEMFKLLL